MIPSSLQVVAFRRNLLFPGQGISKTSRSYSCITTDDLSVGLTILASSFSLDSDFRVSIIKVLESI
jgi:hypothetical protein